MQTYDIVDIDSNKPLPVPMVTSSIRNIFELFFNFFNSKIFFVENVFESIFDKIWSDYVHSKRMFFFCFFLIILLTMINSFILDSIIPVFPSFQMVKF